MPSRQSSLPGESGPDRGSATVLGAVLVAVLLAITVAASVIGSAVVARHRAQASADLAALAAAASLPAGAEGACARGAELARAMATVPADCGIDELDVVIVVEVAVWMGRWALEPARAVARAGPTESAS